MIRAEKEIILQAIRMKLIDKIKEIQAIRISIKSKDFIMILTILKNLENICANKIKKL